MNIYNWIIKSKNKKGLTFLRQGIIISENEKEARNCIIRSMDTFESELYNCRNSVLKIVAIYSFKEGDIL